MTTGQQWEEVLDKLYPDDLMFDGGGGGDGGDGTISI